MAASGKVVYEKTPMQAFLDSIPVAKEKMNAAWVVTQRTLLAASFGVEGGRYNPLVKYVVPW